MNHSETRAFASGLELVGHEQTVPVLGGSPRRYVNLDNAASTPALAEVLATVNRFMNWTSSVHRGTGLKSRVATQAWEDARRTVAGFVGAHHDEHTVLFGKNTTEAINKLSYRLGLTAHDVVLVSQMEHHSNDLPWRARAQVVHVGVDAEGRLDELHLEQLLLQHAGRVRLLAVTGGTNVTGLMPDVHRLAERVHAAGAQIFVDCAQLAPHRAINIGRLADPRHLDYVALSAHKMYAPFGTGALVGRRDTFEQGEPEQRGGGTIAFVSPSAVDWAHGPDRDEAGSPNVVGAVALAAAIVALQRVGMDTIARHEAELTADLLARLATIPGVQVYGDRDPARAAQRLGVISFNVAGLPHALVAAVLSTEFGIGVRSGCFCAHPYLMQLLAIEADEVQRVRARIAAGDHADLPGMVRASFGAGSTPADVDALVEALQTIAHRGWRGRYRLDPVSGEYAAEGWEPDLAACFSVV